MTVSSAPMLHNDGSASKSGGAGPQDDYFNQRRAEYLKYGAEGGRDSPALYTPMGDDPDLPMELSRMPTHMGTDSPNASTDQLIQYPPSYAPPRGHGYNPSNASSHFSGGGGGGPPGGPFYGAQPHHQAQYSIEMSHRPSPSYGSSGGGFRAGAGGVRTPSPGPEQAYRTGGSGSPAGSRVTSPSPANVLQGYNSPGSRSGSPSGMMGVGARGHGHATGASQEFGSQGGGARFGGVNPGEVFRYGSPAPGQGPSYDRVDDGSGRQR